MPDAVLEQSTTEVPQPSPQDLNRQALYEQYYGPSTGSAAPVTEVTAPVVETTAPVVPDPATSAPVTTPVSPEVLQLLQTMQQELVALRNERQTPATSTATTSTEYEPAWIPLLRDGKIKEAEEAMAAFVIQRGQGQIVQAAVTQAREIARAETAVERHVTAVRSANPDLVPLESWIASEAAARMQRAQASGQVKSTDDAIRIYTSSVDEAVASARKLYLTLRGEGQQQAMTRNREVITSQPIPPQQVDTSRPQVTGGQPTEPKVETPQEYLAKREAAQARQKGLG